MGSTISQIDDSVIQGIMSTPVHVDGQVDLNEKDFDDWADYFGPVESHNDFFTKTVCQD